MHMDSFRRLLWVAKTAEFCSFSTSLHQRNGQMGRRPVLTNAFHSHFVTESTDAQSIQDGALCPDHQPLSTFGRTNCNSLSHNSHEAFSGLWGDLFLPKRCGTGGRGGGRYPSAWVKTVTNSSFSVTSSLAQHTTDRRHRMRLFRRPVH